MTAKSILDIEVNDGAFNNFKAAFEAYQENLAKMPGAWGKIGKEIKQTGASFDHLVAASIATASAAERMASNQDKFMKQVGATSYRMEGLARTTASVARNIGEATTSLLKWSAITGALGGLLGLGGLWGIDRLAASAGGARRSALGLGVTSGEQQAFGINYGRAVDPNATLGAIADAKNDLSKSWIFGALGIKDWQNRDAADLAPDVLAAAKKRFDQNPTQQAADAFGLTQILSMDDLRRLHGMSPDELAGMRGGFNRDRNSLAVDEGSQRAWQDFTAQLGRAGQEIENTFIKGLIPLAKPLEHISAGFSDVAEALLKSPQIKVWLGEIGDGLEGFAKFVGSDRFRKDIEDFTTGLAKLVTAIGSALGWISDKAPGVVAAMPPVIRNALPGGAAAGSFGDWYPKNDPWYSESWTERAGFLGGSGALRFGDPQRIMRSYLKTQGMDDATIAGWLASTQKESGFNQRAAGGGLFQFTGAREKAFESFFKKKPEDASFADQLAFAVYDYKNSPMHYQDKVNAADDTPEGRYSAIRKYFEAPRGDLLARDEPSGRAAARRYYGDMQKATPPAKVDITVHNQTGGSAVVAGNQAGNQ